MSTEVIHQISSSGVYVWTAPSGVRSVRFLGMGGGGGGGGALGSQGIGAQVPNAAGAGGGGSGSVEGVIFTIEPGANYEIAVGAGGTGGAAVNSLDDNASQSGHPGGNTAFKQGAQIFLIAFGGGGGSGGRFNTPSRSLPGGLGAGYSSLQGSTLDVKGVNGANGGSVPDWYVGFPNGLRGNPGNSVPNGGGAGGQVGIATIYGANNGCGRNGGGGGGGPKGNGGNSGDCGGASGNAGATGGGGGGGYLNGQNSATTPPVQASTSSGGNGGDGWALLTYSLPDGVVDSPPKAVGLPLELRYQMRKSARKIGVPVDPDNGGKLITPDSLTTGDIIISTNKAWGSKAVRLLAGDGPVGHVGIYLGPEIENGPAVIEALPSEEVVLLEYEQATSSNTIMAAFRHPKASEESANIVVEFAKRNVGERFDAIGGVLNASFHFDELPVTVNIGTNDDQLFFCSEFVLAAYLAAKLPLTANALYPHSIVEISWQNELQYIGHLRFTK